MSSLPGHLAACFVLTVLWLCLIAHLTLASAITLSVTPRIAMAPATLDVRVRVQPAPTDRWIVVELDDGDYQRISEWEPHARQTLYSFRYPDVPAGAYELRAAIGAGTVVRAQDRVTLQILGP